RQDQELGFRSPVLDQHRQHDAGCDCRFGVLLADEHEERLDESPPFVRVARYIAIGTEDRLGKLRYPRAAFGERHTRIDNLQLVEHRHAGCGGGREQRGTWGKGGARYNPLAPVVTRCRPGGTDKRNPRARCCTLAGLFGGGLLGCLARRHYFTACRCEGRFAVWNLPPAAFFARSFTSSFLPP